MAKSELDRFWSYVLKGPGEGDCWLWTGAVGDDGYGRFWLRQGRVMRPQRFLYREVTGVDLDRSTMLLHRCNVTICVRVEKDPRTSHLRPGTGSENLHDSARDGRHRNQFSRENPLRLTRAERVERAVRLRNVARAEGWNEDALRRAYSSAGEDHPTLF